MLGEDTGNKRAVRILLECILVSFKLTMNYFDCEKDKRKHNLIQEASEVQYLALISSYAVSILTAIQTIHTIS